MTTCVCGHPWGIHEPKLGCMKVINASASHDEDSFCDCLQFPPDWADFMEALALELDPK